MSIPKIDYRVLTPDEMNEIKHEISAEYRRRSMNDVSNVVESLKSHGVIGKWLYNERDCSYQKVESVYVDDGSLPCIAFLYSYCVRVNSKSNVISGEEYIRDVTLCDADEVSSLKFFSDDEVKASVDGVYKNICKNAFKG